MASTVGQVVVSSGVRGLTGNVNACCPVIVGVIMLLYRFATGLRMLSLRLVAGC